MIETLTADEFKRQFMGGGDLKKHSSRARHQSGQMNKTEAKMEFDLSVLQKTGEIVAYYFESFKFKLAKNTWYTPDFVIFWADGTIEMRECKGHWEDDARVKIKVAASLYRRFKVTAWTLTKQGWTSEIISA